MNHTIRAHEIVFALDCPDAVALAGFYAELLGWETSDTAGNGEWVTVKPAALLDEWRGFHPVQPGIDNGWIVYRDPAGHLFCLCQIDG